MFTLHLVKSGQPAERRQLEDGAYVLGRSPNSRICLPYPEVSERHAILMVRGGKATIEDLDSANGTWVNGAPAIGAMPVASDAVIQVGSCLLRVDTGEPAPPKTEFTHPPVPSPTVRSQFTIDGGLRPPHPPAGSDGAGESGNYAPSGETPLPPAPPPPPPPPQGVRGAQPPSQGVRGAQPPVARSELLRSVQEQIHKELIARLDLKRMTATGVDKEGMEAKAREKIAEIVGEVRAAGKMPPGIDCDRLERDIFNEAMRLGPIEDLLADERVTEIMVNGPSQVYVEEGGRLSRRDVAFTDDAAVLAVIERIVSPLGRRIDESQPYVDARLKDGSRVNAIIPPLSLVGPVITIRKFSKRQYTVDDFVRFGTWTHNAATFMQACVLMRKNIVVAGGTGSGKTTLLNLLSGFIPETERIVTIEDAAELKLLQPHVVRLEARGANIEGRGAVTIRDLVRNSLRMRPDRIIVGECRGGEALDMLQAMNTGHDGSLTTVHANSPRDVVSRLETMVLMSGMDLPSRAIREQIASAVDIIIHESRMSDGSRKVVAISEVTGLEGSQIVMQDIFRFNQSGIGADGKIEGSFAPTGAVPTFYETLHSRGLDLPPEIFDPASTRTIQLTRS